jgi:hypothetical protein
MNSKLARPWTADDTLQLRALRAAGATLREASAAMRRCPRELCRRNAGASAGPRDGAAIARHSDPQIEAQRRAARAIADARALALGWRLAMLRLARPRPETTPC